MLTKLHYESIFCGSNWIRTNSAIQQQIYSLPRLSNFGVLPSKKNVCQFLFIYFISFLGERLLWKRQTMYLTMSSIYAVHSRVELVASERQSERFAITTMNHFFAISEGFELSSFSLEDRNFSI